MLPLAPFFVLPGTPPIAFDAFLATGVDAEDAVELILLRLVILGD